MLVPYRGWLVSIRAFFSVLPWLVLLLPGPVHAATANGKAFKTLPSVAFYYGPKPPLNALQSFDWIVVDGSAQLPPKVSGIGQGGPVLFAYLSVGELPASAPVPPHGCVIGENAIWKTRIVDLRQAVCRHWLLQQSVEPLLKRGFTHFFLDTLDSYESVITDSAGRAAYNQGIALLLQAIRAHEPQATFILNRGFPLLARAHQLGVVGVAAESLYAGWNRADHRYVKVTAADTAWLKRKLSDVAAHGLVPIAIDYVPDNDKVEAHQIARRIAADGFVPYVTNGALNRVGVGAVDPVPRQILMLYDGASSPMQTQLNWYVAAVLNHLGYATRSIDVDTASLPRLPMQGRIAGVVTWFSRHNVKRSEYVYQWLQRQIAAGIPVAVMGRFGFPTDQLHLGPWGLVPGPSPGDGLSVVSVRHQDPALLGFEGKVHPQLENFFPLRLKSGHAALSLVRDGQVEDAVAITKWGGYALSPYVVSYLPQGTLPEKEGQSQWILNPFAFFTQALRLKPMPAFDTTTLSGNRVMFAHIDGDGFASASYVPAYRGQPAAKVVLEAILKRYKLPVTASVIAGEFVDDGLLSAAQVAANIPIAKAIFALPWVEIGSHTYSHAFDWRALEKDPDLSAGLHLTKTDDANGKLGYVAVAGLKYGYNLPIPGYRFNDKTEIAGSTEIINRKLAPPGKKTVIYQWPGDTDPGAKALAMTYQDGLLNINGNNSSISAQWPSLTNVAPLGVWKGDYFQVYAPDANEDQFTDGWKPPYCGYAKVLQTFRMTEAPRRLGPINIYYHYYAGARPCALAALQSVYAWTVAQPITPIFTTHYARMALGFEYAALARQGRAWILGGYGADQTVRIPKSMGYPDMEKSRNVAGFNDANDARYITLGPGGRARLVLRPHAPQTPYLRAANAPVNFLEQHPGSLALGFNGQVPLRVSLGHARAASCRFTFDGRPVSLSRDGALRRFSTSRSKGRLVVECPSP